MLQQPIVFLGKVVAGGVASIRDDPWYTDPGFVRLEVIEAFRGLAPGTKFVDLETHLWPGMCSPNPYRPGRTYLVIPSRLSASRGERLSDGACFSGRDVEEVSDAVEYLRSQIRNPGRFQIRGRIGTTDQEDAKPLSGVKVSTEQAGHTISTTTDARGRYELAVPGPGTYSVQADLAPYHPVESSITIPPDAHCKVYDFGLHSGSSISGKVWDNRGQPLQQARVGLIDLDRPPPKEPARAWFRTAYPEQPDGSFLFKNVPLGRYLLAFNPDGPQAAGYEPLPLESTFYPNGVGRDQAQVIEIDAANRRLVARDLIVGPPVAFRPVTVKVRFSDGSPMSTGVIHIIGEPVEAGGIAWYGRAHLSKDQKEANFRVPVNRKFSISIRDWHGRDLPKKYESTHLPGSAPVTKEFIIEVP